MAKSKKIWVKFLGASTIAAGVLGDKEVPARPGEPIQLPLEYGTHVIALKLAAKCDAPSTKVKVKAAEPAGSEPTAEVATAEQAVKDAQGALASAGSDEARKLAEAELVKAQEALEALKKSAA